MSETLATVGLNGVKFNAPIGWYPEERAFRNNFEVDLKVTFKPAAPFNDDDLDLSIDYMKLYDICKLVFNQEVKLIETAAQSIINTVVDTIPSVMEVMVQIRKLNPPVKAQIESSFVQLTFKK